VVIPLLSTKGSLVSKLLQKNASGSCLLLSEGSDFRLMHFYSQSHEKDNTVHFCGGFSNVIHCSSLIVWQALRKLGLKPLVVIKKLSIESTREINIYVYHFSFQLVMLCSGDWLLSWFILYLYSGYVKNSPYQ
jgi:hypothetical protein